jgi:Putative beta-barrel porin 2
LKETKTTWFPPAKRFLYGRFASIFVCAAALGIGFADGQDVSPDAGAPEAKPAFRVQPSVQDASQTADGKEVLPSGGKENLPVRTADGSDVSAVPRRFAYEFRLRLTGVYDDNINLSHSDRISDYYFTIEPGITIAFGDITGSERNYIRLDYAPSAFLYVDHSEDDAVQHVIRLDGQYHFPHLTLGFSQDVALLDGTNLTTTTTTGVLTNSVNLDVSGRTRVNLYTTRFHGSYDLSDKTFLSGGVEYSVADYATLISSQNLAGNIFINYNYSPKLVIGIGATGGYNTVDTPNQNQTYEQVNVRAAYKVSGKVSLNASAGVEFRQFEDNTVGTHVSPVYELGGTYQPFDGTTINLTGTRRTLNSAVLADQDYNVTSIIAGVRQRFLQRFYVGVQAGYEHSDYFNVIGGISATRKDDYFFVEPGIDITLTSFWTMGLFYLHRQNSSSSDIFSFYDNQFGLRTSFIF